MALEETTTTTEQTPPPAEPTPIESPGSLAQHREEFPEPDRRTGMRSTPAPEVSAGEKVEKGERNRSRKQDASAKDVPRIHALTSRAKTAEEKLAAAEAELAALKAPKTEPVAPVVSQPPTRTVDTPIPAAGTEPNAADTTKYPYGAADPAYMRDLVAFTIAEERRTQATTAQQADLERSQAEGRAKFAERYNAAKTEIADFDTIAAKPVPWKTGDPIDLWIWARPYGPKLLYYLNHPDHLTETREIMALPVDDQLERLSLLGQRLSGPTNAGNGGVTGAPPPPTVVVPSPRPPTPVRTGSMTRSSAEAPDPSTMSLRQFREAFPPRRRR